jgi:hypothetical protein
MFADDVKIISRRSNWTSLQETIAAADKWSATWDMKLNFSKCNFISVGDPANRPLVVPRINCSHSISSCSQVKDLGVVVDDSFTPSAQCAAAASRARRSLFLLKRSFVNMTPKLFIPLYSALVRPHLEYAVQCWNPYLQKDINLLENVQRLATRMVKGFSGIEYPERLRRLKLFSLTKRRRRGDMILTYNIFNRKVDLEPSLFFKTARTENTRGHSLKLFKPRVSTRRRATCFSQRIINDWNWLPQHIIDSPNIYVFKKQIDILLEENVL